eukprot:381884_1
MTSLEVGSAERTRWYILIAFSLLSASQSNTWFTFSSVPDQVEDYYHLKKPSESGVQFVLSFFLVLWIIHNYVVSVLNKNTYTSIPQFQPSKNISHFR